jgi:hypothetical protein
VGFEAMQAMASCNACPFTVWGFNNNLTSQLAWAIMLLQAVRHGLTSISMVGRVVQEGGQLW